MNRKNFLQKKDSVLKDSSYASPEPAVLMSTNFEAPPPPLRHQFDQMIDFSKPARLPPVVSAVIPRGYKKYQKNDLHFEITRD